LGVALFVRHVSTNRRNGFDFGGVCMVLSLSP
jgi:hypothetical protein